MSNILELTELNVKSKRLERISGRIASKVRFTPPTVISLRKNISSGTVDKSIAEYNSVYNQLRSAVVSAEVAAAEQEARNVALKDPSAQKEEELRNAQIQQDNMIAEITCPEVCKPRLDRLRIDSQKLRGKFGTLGKNYGVNVKKGAFIPKPLSVPKVYSKIYQAITKNSDLYKLADKIGAVDKPEGSITETKVVANWRSLFDSYSDKKTDVVVAMDRKDDDEPVFVQPERGGVSSEELSHRKMVGQLGDELQEVRRLQDSTNGLSSPFSVGLIEREESLLSMLSSLSGVESISKRKPSKKSKKNNTEFQNLIEQIVGYKDPVSEVDHNKKQQAMQEYYSNPDVSDTIDKLRHKDVLFTFNETETYNKVMEAERLDNERIAQNAVAVDLLDTSDDVLDNENDTLLSLGAIKQAEMIQEQNNYQDALIAGAFEQANMLQEQNRVYDELVAGAAEQASILQEQNEYQEELVRGANEQAQMIQQQIEHNNIIVGAEEQARMLQQQAELDEILVGAKEQAQILQQQNDMQFILEGAEEQAKMLKTLYDFMDKQDKIEKASEEEKKTILAGAEEQARLLQAQNERAILIDGAKEQAQQIQNAVEHEQIIAGASEQACQLQAGNDYLELLDSAFVQARIIQDNNDKADLLNGAEEQAMMLNDIPKEVEILENIAEQIVYQTSDNVPEYITGAYEQAQQLQEYNQRADLLNGAEEQAQMIYENNIIFNGAEEQAQMLQQQNERADLINGAEEQAKMIHEQVVLMDAAYEQAQMLHKNNLRIDLVNGAEEQAQMFFNSANAAVVNPSLYNGSGFDMIEENDRYGNIVSPSRPIKLSQVRIANLQTRILRNSSVEATSQREVLTSLKSQLESDAFDFLRYNDNVVGVSKAA